MGVLRFRFSHLQLDPAEYMRVPAADAKHVFIIREAFDVSGFQTAAGQQEIRLAVKHRDGYEIFVHMLCRAARLDSRGRLSPRGVVATKFSSF